MTVNIHLPTLHSGQVKIWTERDRFNAMRCGRRFGKDIFQNTVCSDRAARGMKAALFAPEWGQLSEPYQAIKAILQPLISRSSQTDGLIRTATGGHVDFWTLNDNELAGRGHEYDVIFINEAAFTKNGQMLRTWDEAIRPTLTVTGGSAWILSTPHGVDPDNFFYKVCHDPETWKSHHAPTSANPYVPPSEIELERRTKHPQVFEQEYLAEFIDWSGMSLFKNDKWLMPDGKSGWPMPKKCDLVFAKIDSALKSGREHDGTGILYCARENQFEPEFRKGLSLLDYDLVQIDADLLITHLPKIYERLDHLAKRCGAAANLGLIIEDKGSGIILLQHCKRQGWKAIALDGKFVAAGKDERAMATAGYHEQGLTRITAECLAKEVDYKGTRRNHLKSQVTGYRIGDKNAAKRADDLMDAYGGALHSLFGQSSGY